MYDDLIFYIAIHGVFVPHLRDESTLCAGAAPIESVVVALDLHLVLVVNLFLVCIATLCMCNDVCVISVWSCMCLVELNRSGVCFQSVVFPYAYRLRTLYVQARMAQFFRRRRSQGRC